MDIVVYNTTSGEILKTLSVSDPIDAPLQAGPGEGWIEGRGNKKLHKVVNGVSVGLSPAEIEARKDPITPEEITRERGRKLVQGKVFDVPGYGSVALQGRLEDQITLSGIKDAAVFQIQSGDTTTTTMRFRDRDNVDHILTPPQIVTLWQLGAEWMDLIYNRSWDLKSMDPIPQNYADEGYWT